ncbi:unnamed protein product [Penicillium olsonii]|uniref:FAD-binding PCMH-type domain-containing protein n=1 Tax=Penicillium olsonii TaxID=99116 RepID=A0A9W4HIY1_PENOL|nr:unnamed protein product [Penicillium olsonii]
MKAALLAIGVLAATTSANAKFCRCQPDQRCWPSDDSWARLNSSTDGNLVKVTPYALPCHDPTFNEAECTIAKTNSNSSSYRSSDPGALQWSNWEAWPEKDEQCYIETSKTTPCKQGRIPLFSVKAQEAKHIQEAVNFAAKHNLKLVIKNTGHDFVGRSSAPNSLQIFTHEMKEISILDDFVPTAPKNKRAPPGIKAVTLGAGVQLHEMYSYLGSRGLMVVGGTANTVGITGGYIQGGGHSLLGWLHGMASDNALEFHVVLADGSLVVANDYQNSDLFFALRGGGGGSFGVVVSATVKAHPDYPTVVATINYTTPIGAPYWDGVDALQKHILEINDKGGTGFYGLVPNTPISDSQTVSLMILSATFVNQTDTKAIEDLLAPVKSEIKDAIGLEPYFDVTALPSLSTYYSALLGENDTTGLQIRFASRLISRDLFKSGNHNKLTKAVSSLRYGPGDAIVGAIVAGGQVSENRDIESGLNPAWRDALVHVIAAHWMSPEMTFDQQKALEANITNVEVPLLKSLEPGKMGAYMNEADADETDFQESFWGDNYPRLREIKALRDPYDLFIVRKGVGSEDWDDSGLCRV